MRANKRAGNAGSFLGGSLLDFKNRHIRGGFLRPHGGLLQVRLAVVPVFGFVGGTHAELLALGVQA